MEKVTKMCAWCGERPVRSGKSKYCSWECVEKKYAAAMQATGPVPPVAVAPPAQVAPVADADSPMCEWCGEYPARQYKNGRYSKYCSNECSSRAVSEKSRAWCDKNKAVLSAAAHQENARRKVVREAAAAGRNEYFPPTTPQQDWRDANFNPLG